MKPIKTLIFGGCGCVGRHLVHWFGKNSRQSEVTIIDDLSEGIFPDEWPDYILKPPKLRFFKSDLTDFIKTSDEKFDLVIHAAAIIKGRKNIEKGSDIIKNISLDALFLWYIIQTKPSCSVYMSSSAVYPSRLQCGKRKLKETDFIYGFDSPDAMYGVSKQGAESVIHEIRNLHKLKILCPRPFSGYAPDQSLDYPFPSIIRRASFKEDPLFVWGSGYQSRDFIHLDDVADSIMRAVIHEPQLQTSFNIGTGKATNFWTLAKKAAKAAGYSPKIRAIGGPEGVYFRVADIKFLSKIKGINPSNFKTLEVGIKEALNKQQ